MLNFGEMVFEVARPSRPANRTAVKILQAGTAWLPLLILLSACLFVQAEESAPAAFQEIQDKNTLSIETPSLQDRKTAKIKLPNGLEAYLISDPSAPQSAASLAVNVGSWSDPAEASGIAHFCEHMLFLGTTKYPHEGEYSRFIQERGGSSNAYTSDNHTNYTFNINNDAFEEALDRFSYFFKEPLFNPSGVDREMHAIQGEFDTHLDEDLWRRFYVWKQLGNPQHPDNQFSIGNLQTLSKVSQESLKKWYQEHYSANLMHLVIYSPLPLDKLKELVVADFGGIPNKQKKPLVVETLIRDVSKLPEVVYIAGVKDKRILSLSWELGKPYTNWQDAHPDELIGAILGDEGEGSLLEYLKDKGWAEGIVSGVYERSDNSLIFGVEVQLTDEGFHAWEKVAAAAFDMIRLVQKEGVPQYIYDETRQMDLIHYRFQQRQNAFDVVSDTARGLILEPLETYPLKTQVATVYDPQLLKNFAKELTPEHCLFTLVAPPAQFSVDLNQKDPWFGTAYTVAPLKEKTLALLKKESSLVQLKLPPPNPLIPKKLTLINVQPQENVLVVKPDLAFNNSLGQLYYATDAIYRVPEVQWIFTVRTPSIQSDDAQKVVLADLYIKAIKEELNPYIYQAQQAGLTFDLTQADNGIRFVIGGYSENAPLFLEQICKALTSLEISEEKFKLYKRILKKEYQNFSKESPLTLALEGIKSLLYEKYVTAADKVKALSPLTYIGFKKGVEDLYDNVYLEAMLYGNMDASDAKKAWGSYLTTFKGKPYAKENQYRKKVIVLPEDKGPFFLEKYTTQNGHAVVLAIQEGAYSFKDRAAQQMLDKLISQPFYDELRTRQQTGYIVTSWSQEIEKQLFSFFAVQSSNHSNRDLLARFELFIEEFLKNLRVASDRTERVDGVRTALIDELSQPPQNQAERAAQLQIFAFKEKGQFDWLEKRIAGFKQLSNEEFFTLADQFLGRTNRRRPAVLIKGKLPDDKFLEYTKLKGSDQLVKVSSYTSAEE